MVSGCRWLPLATAEHCWPPLGTVVCCWVPLGAAGHICANFATCSWQPLTMLNPQFVAGEHGLFGGHKSEDIRTLFYINYKKFFSLSLLSLSLFSLSLSSLSLSLSSLFSLFS